MPCTTDSSVQTDRRTGPSERSPEFFFSEEDVEEIHEKTMESNAHLWMNYDLVNLKIVLFHFAKC